jgi:hypothetical protein
MLSELLKFCLEGQSSFFAVASWVKTFASFETIFGELTFDKSAWIPG